MVWPIMPGVRHQPFRVFVLQAACLKQAQWEVHIGMPSAGTNYPQWQPFDDGAVNMTFRFVISAQRGTQPHATETVAQTVTKARESEQGLDRLAAAETGSHDIVLS